MNSASDHAAVSTQTAAVRSNADAHSLRGRLGRARYLGAAAAALGLAVLLGACSSSPTARPGSSSPSSSAPQGSATFHAKLQVTGSVLLTKTYTDKVSHNSCSYAAAHGDAPGGRFEVPTPGAGVTPRIHIQLASFHGAGTYPPSKMKADKSDSIWLSVKGVTNDYEINTNPTPTGQVSGKEVLFLYKNGSGYLVFSEAHQLGKASSPKIAGLINWTCTS
jgi:hypothetical protein